MNKSVAIAYPGYGICGDLHEEYRLCARARSFSSFRNSSLSRMQSAVFDPGYTQIALVASRYRRFIKCSLGKGPPVRDYSRSDK
jgi:hypothetical protein